MAARRRRAGAGAVRAGLHPDAGTSPATRWPKATSGSTPASCSSSSARPGWTASRPSTSCSRCWPGSSAWPNSSSRWPTPANQPCASPTSGWTTPGSSGPPSWPAPPAWTRTRSGPKKPLPEAPEYPVLSVPPSRLVGSLLLSEQSFFVVLGARGLRGAVRRHREPRLLLLPDPGRAGPGRRYWGSFNKGYNFTAAISPDGIRLRYGLLDTQAQTLPPGRIQALKVTQPPLWRIFGWYRMQVNVAGYGASGSNGEGAVTHHAAARGHPGRRDEDAVPGAPGPGNAGPGTRLRGRPDRHAPAGRPAGRRPRELGAADGGFVTTPRRARLLAPLGWRRNGFTATDTALLIRSGRWWRAAGGGSAPAHAVDGPAPGSAGPALRRGGPGPAHHSRPGVARG